MRLDDLGPGQNTYAEPDPVFETTTILHTHTHTHTHTHIDQNFASTTSGQTDLGGNCALDRTKRHRPELREVHERDNQPTNQPTN